MEKTNTELAALQKELGLTREKLETSLAELEKHAAQVKALTTDLESAKHARADEVADRDARLLDLSEQFDGQKARITELEAGFEGLNEELAKREKELRSRADEFDAIRAERDAHAARADALENDDQSRALLMDKARTALSLAQTFFTQLTETAAPQDADAEVAGATDVADDGDETEAEDIPS